MRSDLSAQERVVSDVFDARRADKHKIIFLFQSDKTAEDFARKYNDTYGLRGLSEQEKASASYATAYSNDCMNYVVIPDIPAHEVDYAINHILRIGEKHDWPSPTTFTTAHNDDALDIFDFIGDQHKWSRDEETRGNVLSIPQPED